MSTVFSSLKRGSRAARPTVYGSGQAWQQALPQRTAPYKPTPWLPNAHWQLLFFDGIRKRSLRFDYDRHDVLTMSDGGQTALAWSGYALPADMPTIVLLHTITGSADSMREMVRDLRQYTGWRVVLCLRRGHGELPLPVAKINILGCTDDLHQQLQVIQQHFPQSPLYAIGSSAGSGLLVRYLGEHGERAVFKAAFAYCPGYNTDEAFGKAHKVYSRLMAKKLIRRFVQPHRLRLTHLATLNALTKAKDLASFHAHSYELAGFASYADFNQASNPMQVFANIRTPLLVLNAEDDPVCKIDNLYPYLPLIEKMPNVLVVTTAKGSHCAYYEGWGARSWAHRLMANYFLWIASEAE